MSSSVEILGQWITLPDPDSVASLSNRYYDVCTTLEDTKSQLSAIGSPQAAAGWTGQAADAFAARLGTLPGELEQAWQSYQGVARALSGYASNLRPVVAALRSLAYQGEEAEGTLNATVTARDQAIRTGQESATGLWNTKLAQAQAAVSALARRRSSLLTELDELSAECVRQIRQAGPESVHQDLLSDLRRYAVDAGNVIWRTEDDVLHFELRMGKDLIVTPLEDLFVRPFTDLWDDMTTPGKWNWAKWGAVLGDVSSVLGVLAVVLAPIPGLDLVDAVLVPAAMATGLLAAGAEVIGVSEHEKHASLTDAAFDLGGVALMGAGNVIGQGLKVARLANGDEAEVSAKSLWDSGSRNFFNLSDSHAAVPGDSVVTGTTDNVKETFDADGHLGVEKDTDPSQHPFERAELGIDRVGDGLNILNEQLHHGRKSGTS